MLQARPLMTLLAALLVAAAASAAVTVYECVDEAGERFYADQCPPGTQVAEEKRLRGTPAQPAPDLAAIAAENPVTLYAVPQCDACDLVRNQLQRRGIPFTEKDASGDLAIQDELKSLAGGLTVPVVSLSGNVLTGYNRAALDAALDEAGYPAPPARETAPEAAGSAGADR